VECDRQVAPYTNRQNLSVEWDLNGSLKDRSDRNQGGLYEEFFYDYVANGNMTRRSRGGTVSGYSCNLPNSITQDTCSSQFSDTPNRACWRQEANYGGTGR